MHQFRQRLRNRERLFGTFQKTPSMMVSEVLAQTAMDVVCLDAEHAPFDRRDIDACVYALRAHSMPVLVRPASAAPEQLLNALDCGADGVLVPHVATAQIAAQVAKACRYGNGGRGYAGSTRAAGYGAYSIKENVARNHQADVVIAQIEDPSAIDQIEAIVAIEEIDCFFIGMVDLAVGLGCESLDDEKLVSAAQTICQAANKQQRPLGAFIADLDKIPFWQEQGISLFLLSCDHVFLKSAANDLLARLKTSD